MVLEARGIAGVRVLVGLLSLTHSYTRGPIDQACQIALSHGAIRLKTIRGLLKRSGSTQQQFEFLEEHPIIRRLEDSWRPSTSLSEFSGGCSVPRQTHFRTLSIFPGYRSRCRSSLDFGLVRCCRRCRPLAKSRLSEPQVP